MNKNNMLLVCMVFAAVALCLVVADAQIDDTTLGNPQSVNFTNTNVDPTPYVAVQTVTGNSSTTAVVAAVQTGRKELEIRVNTASKDIWVSTTASAATVAGAHCVLVTSIAPFKAPLGAAVPVSIIASEAISHTIISYK